MNVIQILTRYGIEFVDHGPNVAKGNVNIQCPWCGADDHSHHLGINLARGMWGCWRNKQHRGRALYKLLSKLTGLSYQEARRATGEGRPRAVQQGEMERAVDALQHPRDASDSTITAQVLSLPRNVRPMHAKGQRPYAAELRFQNYIKRERNFRGRDVKKVCRRYDLHYCVSGDFSDRLILPVYEGKRLMTWLGRSIYKNDSLRYRALDKEESIKQVKDCIYGYDRACKGGKTLVIVEGALDQMKVDFYNYKVGIRSIGLFNMNLEPVQLDLLVELKGLYDRYIILLDEGELGASLRLESELRFLSGIEAKFLRVAKDPGELTPVQAAELRTWL